MIIVNDSGIHTDDNPEDMKNRDGATIYLTNN